MGGSKPQGADLEGSKPQGADLRGSKPLWPGKLEEQVREPLGPSLPLAGDTGLWAARLCLAALARGLGSEIIGGEVPGALFGCGGLLQVPPGCSAFLETLAGGFVPLASPPTDAPRGQQLARVGLLPVATEQSFSELARGQGSPFLPPPCSDRPVPGSGETSWNDSCRQSRPAASSPACLGNLCLQLPLLGVPLSHGGVSLRAHLASVDCSRAPRPLLSVARPT